MKDKRILITGASGFLGRHVVTELRAAGYTRLFLARSSGHAGGMWSYDLRSQSDTKKLFTTINPEIVINCAAHMGGIGANREHPGAFFYDNLMIGANVLEQARKSLVEKVVQIGTVCCYPKYAAAPFQEDALWEGAPEETNGPYGHAKRMLIVQSAAYRQEYGLNSITLLPANLYGPGDNFDLSTSHVIPALIRKVLAAISMHATLVEMWGDGSPSRDFLYVEDAARAVRLALEQYNSSAPVNLATGAEIKMHQLAAVVAELLGWRGTFVWDASKPNGQPRRMVAHQRATQHFGFTARVTLREGLQQTIDWVRVHGI